MPKKQRQWQTRRQRAGKWIFSGSSGCAFGNPPLKCKGEATRRNSKYVSKLMNKYNAREEYNDATPFQFNATKQYFIWPESQCEVDRANIQPTNELDKCEAEAGYSMLLFSENGGDNLWDLHLKAEDYIPFFESLVNLFNGLEAMRQGVSTKTSSGTILLKKLAHCDIKPLNIVTLKQADGRFHTRFIDFGLALDFSDYTTLPSYSSWSDRMATFTTPYFIWPFEVALYARSFGNPSKSQDENLIEHITKWYATYKSLASQSMPENAYYSGSSSDDANRRITLDVAKSLVPTAPIPMKDILHSLDVYSMGISLSYIYKRFVRQQQLYDSTGSLSVSNVVPSNPWQVEVADTITKPISQLIIGMTAIRPEDRLKPLEVKAQYEAILPAMRKLFTADQLNKELYSLSKLPDGFQELSLSPTNLGLIQITPPKVNVPLPPPSPVRVANAVAPTLAPAAQAAPVANAVPKPKKKFTLKRNNSGKIVRKPAAPAAAAAEPAPPVKKKWVRVAKKSDTN
jgi:serine/threonine protein kinase